VALVGPGGVLFVCTYNRVRSPMAAGLMRKLYGQDALVDSCGLEPGSEVDAFAAAVMAEVGVDLLDHTPQRLEDLIADGRFTRIVTLSEEAEADLRGRDLSPAPMHWTIADPAHCEDAREARLEAYRLTRSQIHACILDQFGAPPAGAVVRL